MIRDAGLLGGGDTGRLVVVDIEALEAVEDAAHRGAPPLPSLLADHAASARADYGFKEWLLLSRPGLRPTRRITDRWDRAFAPAFDALQRAAGGTGAAQGGARPSGAHRDDFAPTDRDGPVDSGS